MLSIESIIVIVNCFARQMNVVFQLLQAKQVAADKLAAQGKVKYEYDSDEDVDDAGTWEHKRSLPDNDHFYSEYTLQIMAKNEQVLI